KPCFDGTRIALDGAAEVTLGSSEVPAAEIFFTETEIVLGTITDRRLCHRGRAGRSQAARGRRIVFQGRRVFLGRTTTRAQEIAHVGCAFAPRKQQQASKRDKLSTRSCPHRCFPPAYQAVGFSPAGRKSARHDGKPVRSS